MSTRRIFKNITAVVFTGIFLFALTIRAQDDQHRQPPPPTPDSLQIVKMVDELSATLSLSKEQKAEILKLHFDHFAEAKALMNQKETDREKHRSKMDSLRKGFEDRIKSLLNDEQIKSFEEFLKTHGPQAQQQPKMKNQTNQTQKK